MRNKPQWYRVKAEEDTAELEIFGDIGASWRDEDSVTLADFKRAFDSIKDRGSIRVLINSYGGDVFEGIAIYNVIAAAREKVEIEVMGVAASAASIIALAGKSLTMAEGSFFMIHNAWGMAMGTAEDMRQMAATLEKINGELVGIYENHSDLDVDEIKGYMDEETWFTAEEAVEAGFAVDTVDRGKVAASIRINREKYGYKHTPEGIAASEEKRVPQTAREFEALLRDSGFSRKRSVEIAARGFDADQGEPEPEPDEQRDSAPPEVEAVEQATASYEVLLRLRENRRFAQESTR